MLQIHKRWLEIATWETVLTVNQALCQTKELAHQPNLKTYEGARRAWEQATHRQLALHEVLDLCRQCHALTPFTFNNGNTFAAIAKTFIEDFLKALPPVEAEILRATVSHYVVGQVGKKELNQIFQHFEPAWNKAPRESRDQHFRAPSAPQAAPQAKPQTQQV